MRRRLAPLALVAALLAACSTQVDPTNPWDSDTPGPQKAKASISGRILVASIAAALVPIRLRQNGVEIDSTFTLDDGSYIFRDLVPGAYVVEAERAGFQKYVYPVSLAAGQVASLEGNLEALGGLESATLKGLAHLEDQVTHGGILVEALDPGTSATLGYTAITASDGKYQFVVPEGTYDLRFVRTDFVNSTQQGITAVIGAAVEVPEITLPVNPATVVGQVVAETLAGGTAPLANAIVTLDGTSNTGLTGADGSFALTGVYAGSYLLRVVKAGYLDASVPVIGLDGGETRNLSEPLTLALARGAISGTVQLADDPDASGVIVEATGTGVATVTGASGAFQLAGLVEGTYEVTLRKDGYAPAVRSSISVTSGAVAGVGTVTLARQGGTIAVVPSAVTNSRNVTVQLNAATATGYRISQDPTFADPALGDTFTSPVSPRPYSGPGSTHAFVLDDLDGRHELYVVFYDGATASTPASTSVVLDRTKPSGAAVVVEGGAGYTRNTVVGLSLSAQDLPPAANIEVSGLASVEIAGNATFTGPTTLSFAVSTTWSIGAGDGTKTVYVRFTDKAGNVSDPASASIVLDVTPPSSPAVALTGGAGTPAGFTGSPLVNAALSATDANAGAGGENLQVKLSNSSGLGGASWQPFSASVPFFVTAGDGLKTVYAQFMDPAGNLSVVANGTITLTATPPSAGTLVVEGGAEATSKATVNVSVSATGATQMRFFVNGTAATAWIPYATTGAVALGAAPDETVATLSVNFRNTAGVEGGSASASILVDRRAPVSPQVAVNANAPFTGGAAVVLAVSADDSPAAVGGVSSGVARVEVSNSATFTPSTSFPYAAQVPWAVAGGDGNKTVFVRFVDGAGNVSAAASDLVILDGTPPASPTLTLAGNAEAQAGITGTPIVTATLSATDANGGAGNVNLEVRISNDLGFAASSWQPFAASTAWVLAPGDGPKTVYAQFRDRAGNVSATASGTITLASTAPSNGRLVIEGGAPATNKATVGLVLSADGASQMRVFRNGAPVAGWVAYAGTSSVDVSGVPDEAPVVIAVSFRNTGGVEGGGASSSILVDRRAPTSPAVAVNGGAEYAGSTAAVLTLSALDAPLTTGTASGLDRVEVANNATFTGSTFFPIAPTVAWALQAGDGAKTVYARFLDKAGNVSAAASDAIVLDATAPSGVTLALAGNPEAQAGTTGTPIVTATVTATDANGGAGNANLEIRVSNDLGFSASSWQPFASSLAWVLTPGDGAKTVYAQVRDRASNVSSPPASAGITLAGTAPSNGTLVVEGGAAATNKATLSVALSATGATQMRLFVNGTAATGWVAYATSTTVSVAALPDETPAVIAVSYRGTGGVEGGGASDSILIDRRAPTSPAVTVNAGAAFAASTAVTLSVSATEAPASTGAASGLDRVEVANNSAFTGSTFFPFADGLAWTLAAGDGAKTVYVRFVDRAGNVSASANDGITLDGTAPASPTVTLTGNPEATAGNTGSPIVTAALSATDANGGSGNANLQVRLSNDLGFAGASWQPFASSVAWVLSPGDGTKTVYAQFRDPAGNVSGTASGNINLVASPPSSGSLVIAGGAAATATQTVSLAISATGATQMRLFVNGVAATAWIAYATSTTVDLGASPNEATRVVSVGFRNAGGVEGGGTSASIRFDTVAPAAGVLAVTGTLGNGSTSGTLSSTPAVVLRITPPAAATDVTQMALVQATTALTACTTMYGSPQWEPLALSATFVLTGADGAKRVCVLFRDGAGNFSTANAVPAGITLDTTPPTNPAFVNVQSTTQNSPLAPKTGNPTITAASDTNGVTYQCVGGFSPGYGSQWADCGAATTLPRPWNLLNNSENTLGVRARDGAFNYSPGSFVRIVHDDVAPTPPFIVELRSSRDSLTVIWDATADVDVVDYTVFYGNAAGDLAGTGAAQGPSPISAGARPGMASGTFTLTGLTQGIPYYVAVEAVDAAGNRSGPSGQRSAVPNKANPRLLSTFAATPRTLGLRTTVSKTFLYQGNNQGITQVDVTTENAPFVSGRAFLPDTVPVERAKLAVFDCTRGGTAGHCVVPSGTTLEGDYRGDYDFYRAASPIVFFPLTGSAAAPVVGTIEAILPTRPTHVVPYTSGGVTYLAAVDAEGIRVFTLSPTNPSLVRQVASTTHAAPVTKVMAVGLNGSELYMVARVDSRYFGGPADYPLVFGYELADASGGDVYALFSEHELRSSSGEVIGDAFSGDPDPSIAVDGGVYALYYSNTTGDTHASAYNPAAPNPTSTVTVYSGASSDGGEPDLATFGAGQLFVWTKGGLDNPGLRQITVSGFNLTLGGTLSLNTGPYAVLAGQNHLGATRVFTIENSSFDPVQRSIRRHDVTGTTVAASAGVQEQIRAEYFAGADGVLYVSQVGSINTVDITNPFLPRIGTAFSSATAVRNFTKVVAHGRFLYAAFGPAVFGAGQVGGVGIFRMTDNGGLQRGGTIINPIPLRTASFGIADVSARDLAVVGRWLFATGTDGGLRAFDLTAGGAAGSPNNPATSIPTLVNTLAGSFNRIAARKDTSGTNYEAMIYTVVNRQLLAYGWNGASFTLVGTGSTLPTNATVTSVDVAGTYATVGTYGGSYLYSVSSPSGPFTTGAAVYPIAGPTKLQSGYLVGLAAGGDSSGPAFLGRSAGANDGSLRFSTCAASGSGDVSIFHERGLYAASCQKNGVAVLSASGLEGMKLVKSYDISAIWTGGAALATDGMQVWTGGPVVWNGAQDDRSRVYVMDEQTTAEGSVTAPFWATNLSGPDVFRGPTAMVHSDGVTYVATTRIAGSPTLDAYESTTPYTYLGRYTFASTEAPLYMVTDGDYAYVARNSGSATRVDVVDIRNPAAMALRATTGAIANREIAGLTLNRDRLFAGLYQGSAQVHEIRVWDTSTVQSSGTVTALATVGPPSEGSITGVAVSGNTIAWTVHDPTYRVPLFGFGIGTLGTNRDGTGFVAKLGSPWEVSEPQQSPVFAGDVLYTASNVGLQAWDLRGWWTNGAAPVQGGAVSLADPHRLYVPVKLQIEGPFGYLVGSTLRSFDLR